MADQSPRPRRARTAQILSTVLFIAAIGFAAAALWIMFNDDSKSGPDAPPPAKSAEEVDLAQVLAVLKAQDDDWDYGRSPATAHTDQLPMPGQLLKLDDHLLFVFIFTGTSADDRVAAREAAGERVDLETMKLTTPSQRVVNDSGQPLFMAEDSIVIAILVGGDQALADEVSQALANLP
jgi:hypothetical protein